MKSLLHRDSYSGDCIHLLISSREEALDHSSVIAGDVAQVWPTSQYSSWLCYFSGVDLGLLLMQGFTGVYNHS